MLSLVAATFLVFSAPAIPSILVADGLAPSAMKLLQQSGAKIVDRHLSDAELSGGGLQDFDAVIVRSATMLSAAAIKDGAAGRLRVIGRAGVGVDNIDVAAALEHGCWVVNTPGASTASVVELTLAHMLAAARGLQVADQGLKTGRWLKGKIKLGVDDGPRVGHELRGKRLGLLGFGRIAQGVARAASALGMVVHAYSRHAQPEVAASLGVFLEPSEADLFAKCTHVAVLCSLTEETRGLVDRRRMALMPKKGLDGTLCGAHLFNLARGGIVVEADVVSALATGDLSTYAADVFEQEPPPTNSPLLRCAGFNGTPHVGAATLEAQARVGTQIATNVLAALSFNGGRSAELPDGIVCDPRRGPLGK